MPIHLIIGIAFVGIAFFVFFLYAQSFFRREGFLRRMIPYLPRTPVPWIGMELFFFFIAWNLILGVSVGVCRNLQFSSHIQERVLEPERMQELLKEHEITQLIVCGRDDPRIFLVVLLTGVIVIPIGEEFLFRLLLQGYLEKLESSLRKFLRMSRGLFAVLCPAAIFAAIHLRSTAEKRPFQNLFDDILAFLIGYIVLIAATVAYLSLIRGATSCDLGIDRRKIFGDCLLGFGTACLLTPPIYLLNHGLTTLVGDVALTLDPIPIFFFSVGTGVLYFRTHRILPGIMFHMVFNGIAVVSAYINASVSFSSA